MSSGTDNQFSGLRSFGFQQTQTAKMATGKRHTVNIAELQAPNWLKVCLQKIDVGNEGLDRKEIEEMIDYATAMRESVKYNSADLDYSRMGENVGNSADLDYSRMGENVGRMAEKSFQQMIRPHSPTEREELMD